MQRRYLGVKWSHLQILSLYCPAESQRPARQIDEAAAARSGIPVANVEQSSTGETPAGRYGEPDGFGAVAAFLCSAPASYVTGAALRCDGGLVAQSLKIFFDAESPSRLSKLQSGFSHSAGNTDNGTVV